MIALCEHLLAERADEHHLWLAQGRAYLEMNQPVKAAENYEVIDRLGKSTADNLNMLGDIYTNEGIFDVAVDRYVAALTRFANSRPDRALRAARVLAARGAITDTHRLISAIEALPEERLVSATTQPDDRTELTNVRKELLKLKARLAAASDSADDAQIAILEEIIKLDPLDGHTLILLGNSYRTRNASADREKAVFCYERAARLGRPFDADAKVRHAQLLVAEGRYSEAVPLLRQAQDIQPRDHIDEYLRRVEQAGKSLGRTAATQPGGIE